MKKAYLKIVVVIICITIIAAPNKAKAQDPVYAQYFTSPLSLNPALAGSKSNLNNRFSLTYRNLLSNGGASLFKTTSLSYERKITKRDSSNRDYFAIGGMFYSEKMGNGLLTQSFGNFTTSYFNALNDDGTTGVSAGISVSYGNRMLDIEKARTQDMFSSFGFSNPGTTIDPSLSNINVSYIYANAGVGYDAKLSEQAQWHFGAAMFRVSKPNETKSGNTKLDPRYVLESNLTQQLSSTESLEFLGTSQWMSAKNFTTVGLKYGKSLDIQHLIEIGVLNRIRDAVIPYVGLGFNNGTNNLKFGLSYEIVTSKVRTIYNAQSTAELSFIWTLK
ncbi:MAG: PorP/SprF family type IX secretion system membrane protein [Sediminibacterium sp.]